MKILNCLVIVFWVLNSIVLASEDIKDKYPQSELYNKPIEVIPNVFSAIGATAPPTYENSGHNNNLSFVITDILFSFKPNILLSLLILL